jgi:hypothetical protein
VVETRFAHRDPSASHTLRVAPISRIDLRHAVDEHLEVAGDDFLHLLLWVKVLVNRRAGAIDRSRRPGLAAAPNREPHIGDLTRGRDKFTFERDRADVRGTDEPDAVA